MKHILAVMLAAVAIAAAAPAPRIGAQKPAPQRPNLTIDGNPVNPLTELSRRADREAADKRFKELKDAAAEMADLSRKVSEEIDKGGPDVISARIFERLDKIEKLVKQVRNKAKDGF